MHVQQNVKFYKLSCFQVVIMEAGIHIQMQCDLSIYLPSKCKIFDSFPWKKGGTALYGTCLK